MTTVSRDSGERHRKDANHPDASVSDPLAEESEAPVDVLRRLDGQATELLDEYLGSGRGEENKHLLDDLADVAREADELLASVDLPALVESVRLEDLPEAIDEEKLPDAVANLRPQDAIAYEKLLALVDLREALDAINVREARRNQRELDAEVEDVQEYVPLDDGDEADGGGSDETESSVTLDEGTKSELLTNHEGKQAAVQAKIGDTVGELREQLLEVHETVHSRVEENDLSSRRVRRPDSLNPTAYSSLSRTRPDMEAAPRFASVPSDTRYSSAPNHERIYGNRFRTDRFQNPKR